MVVPPSRHEPPGIRILPIGDVAPWILDTLRPELSRRFGQPTTICEAVAIDPDWFDAQREQYRADPILDAVIARDDGKGWILAVADVDLYVPGLNFIFGQATVGGCCALIGLARLRQEFYGKPPEPGLFQRRVLIEAVHELGHVAGHSHCPNPDCVMHFSSTIEDTDHKGPDFCDLCGSR